MKATEVTAGMAESNGSLLPGLWRDSLHVTWGADCSGGFRGVRPHPPWRPSEKFHGLPISKTVRTADSMIIIITNFYLAASSHEIFLTVGGREGMKGLGALQRHQRPHPPKSATAVSTPGDVK